jgi:hypothetical protein
MFYSKISQNSANINEQPTIVIQDLHTLLYLHVCIDTPQHHFLSALAKFNDDVTLNSEMQFLHYWQYWWHYVYTRLKHKHAQKIYFISHYHLATALLQKNPYVNFMAQQNQKNNAINATNHDDINDYYYKYYHVNSPNDLQAYLKRHQSKQILLEALREELNGETKNISSNQNSQNKQSLEQYLHNAPKILIDANLMQLIGIKGMQQLINTYDMRLTQNQPLKKAYFTKSMQYAAQRLQLLHVCINQHLSKNIQVIYIDYSFKSTEKNDTTKQLAKIYLVQPLYILNLGFKDVYDVLYR